MFGVVLFFPPKYNKPAHRWKFVRILLNQPIFYLPMAGLMLVSRAMTLNSLSFINSDIASPV